MDYQSIIQLAKYLSSGFVFILLIYRWIRIAAFNNSVEEPVPFRVLSFYNNMEVDGTDVPVRRNFMRRMNRLLVLVLATAFFAVAIFFLPTVLRKFGL